MIFSTLQCRQCRIKHKHPSWNTLALRDVTKFTFRVDRDPRGLTYVHQVYDEADENHG